jgi:hypothetical protein
VKVDSYTKVVLTVIAVALSALAINYIVAPQPAVAAAPALALGEGRYQIVMSPNRTVDGYVLDTRSGTIYGFADAFVAARSWFVHLDMENGYMRSGDQ